MPHLLADLVPFLRMPRVRINLMLGATRGNDPFYAHLVREFYAMTCRRHPKLPVFRDFRWGVALCPLGPNASLYDARIEPSGLRNRRKAERLGYTFRPLEYNRHLDDVRGILASTNVRQGAFDAVAVAGGVSPVTNPASTTNVHDYQYYGVFQEGRLFAYAACLVAGELALIEHIYGHAAHQPDGIVPMLLCGMAQALPARHPALRWYGYGTYFGAGAGLRRFKKKFAFLPHRVCWVLGEA